VRRAWLAAALGVSVAILVGCLLPARSLPHLPGSALDKVQHLLAFALFGLAWHRVGLALRRVLLLGVLLAALTEVGQVLLREGRAGEWLDALADVAGVTVGAGISVLAGRRPGVAVALDRTSESG
jgi:hypothetical protein